VHNRRSEGESMKVLIPAALQSYTHESPIEAVGHTLDELFDDLERRYPGLRFRVVDERKLLRPNLRIFVNGIGVRELGHVLQPDDFVAVVLALSGG
jgi:molybdopterin converting factor small subunit